MGWDGKNEISLCFEEIKGKLLGCSGGVRRGFLKEFLLGLKG